MADPAAHEAREDARRQGTVVGSDVDRVESVLLAEMGDDAPSGAWWPRGEVPA